MCAILTVLEDIFYHIYICKTKITYSLKYGFKAILQLLVKALL